MFIIAIYVQGDSCIQGDQGETVRRDNRNDHNSENFTVNRSRYFQNDGSCKHSRVLSPIPIKIQKFTMMPNIGLNRGYTVTQ